MTQPTRLAVLPGSFDPLTLGHVDLIERARRLFDRVIVAVLVNADKRPMLPVDERLAVIREVFHDAPDLDVEPFDGLLAEYVRRREAAAVVRGLRGGTDLDYEAQMAGMNRHLHAGLETVFLLPSPQVAFISSRLVRQVASLGGPLDGLVPDAVRRHLLRRHEAAVHRNV